MPAWFSSSYQWSHLLKCLLTTPTLPQNHFEIILKTTLLHSCHVASLLANLSSCSFVTFFFLSYFFFPESYWISFQYILFNDVHFSERIIDWSHRLFILLTHALNVLWLHIDLQWLKNIGKRDYFSSRCALQLISVTLPIPSLLCGWKRSE